MDMILNNNIDAYLVKYIEIFPLYNRKTHDIISPEIFMKADKVKKIKW